MILIITGIRVAVYRVGVATQSEVHYAHKLDLAGERQTTVGELENDNLKTAHSLYEQQRTHCQNVHTY